MIFSKNAKTKHKNDVKITLLGKLLKNVESTVYLGYTLHETGRWQSHICRRIAKAQAWDGIAVSLMGSAGGATAAVAADVRGAAAEVGVLYGAELWAAPQNTENAKIDQAQAKIAKEILRVRSSTEAAGVLTELGWAATSMRAWRQRLLFWWRLGRTKSELLRTLEWQAMHGDEQNENLDDSICEYNWWRATSVQIKALCEYEQKSSEELRKMKRKKYCEVVDRFIFELEYSTRINLMKTSSRMASLANEIETRRLRNPKLVSWRQLRGLWLEHISSRSQVRLLTMTRVGTLPIEMETGRWHKVEKEQRFCEDCKTELGTVQHFLRECPKLKSAPILPWLEAPPKNTNGQWWRDTARKLEVRWREKRTIQKATHKEVLMALLAESEVDLELYDEDEEMWKNKHRIPTFIDPGDKAPNDITLEIFTDGSKTPECRSAGWGFWGVYFSDTESPTQTVEAYGPVDRESEQTNMTGELSAIYFALQEIKLTPVGSKCLLRFDCIPAMMLATGVYKNKKNEDLVANVYREWSEVSQSHVLLHQHAKGHANIYGNVRADKAADKGTSAVSEVKEYRAVSELGGLVRFAEYYHASDCGRDCDLERKYAGKARARKHNTFKNNVKNHSRAIEGHLRHLDPDVQQRINAILREASVRE